MSISKTVEDSLKDAESNLRNALAFAARTERPMVAKNIADMISRIDSLLSTDSLLDKLENLQDRLDGGKFFISDDEDDD
jgi:hypothetical protein